MTVSLTGLAPGEPYYLAHCHTRPGTGASPDCPDPFGAPPLVAAADGTATATVTAEQWLGTRTTYCRDRCTIAAFSPGIGWIAVDAPYAMATGSLAAEPDTGLTDGETVTVTGTDVLSSYAGPDVWIIHTGQWGLVQCDAGLADDPTLYGVFANCALTQGGPVDVPGSTFTRDVPVAASLDRILGGTTDCTAAPGACVLALGRFEADGSATLLTTPLAFGPPG